MYFTNRGIYIILFGIFLHFLSKIELLLIEYIVSEALSLGWHLPSKYSLWKFVLSDFILLNLKTVGTFLPLIKLHLANLIHHILTKNN